MRTSGKNCNQARSISRPVWARLRGPAFTGYVLATFKRTCNLVDSDGQMVALVLPEIDNGPLNVVVNGGLGDFASAKPGMPVRVEDGRLQVGDLEIALARATIWEPCPDWDRVRTCSQTITQRLSQVRELALSIAPANSLLSLGHPPGSKHRLPIPKRLATELHPWPAVLLATATEAAQVLWEGWQGVPGRLSAGASQLSGLGKGLTPAGDDFLSGVMLWAWVAHPEPGSVCQTLLQATASRTTTLSTALLQAAARGECNAAWHRLLAALKSGPDLPLEAAIQAVLAHGHTSGADTLAGFLWIGLYPRLE
jgi:hypothetical protein